MNQSNLKAGEWLEKAKHDLGTAQLLLNSTDYYDVIVYHAHQTVEKILKWFLIENDKKFPFVHDLVRLLGLCEEVRDYSSLRLDITRLNELLPKTRYPYGEKVIPQEAEYSVEVAKKVYALFVE